MGGRGLEDGAFSFGRPHVTCLFDDSVKGLLIISGLFLDIILWNAAIAVVFARLTTATGNRVGETITLGKLFSSATKPLWAVVLLAFYSKGSLLPRIHIDYYSKGGLLPRIHID